MSKSDNTLAIAALIFVIVLGVMAIVSNQQAREERQKVTERQEQLKKVEKEYKLNYELLSQSIKLGTKNLINNQKPEGNFNYAYNFITKELIADDSQVRQAGALWGLALIYNDKPTLEVEAAIQKGLDYFISNSRETADGAMYVTYPGAEYGKTGTTALIALTLIDYLRTGDNEKAKEKYKTYLDKYIKFIPTLIKKNGHIYGCYAFEDGKGYGDPSPYFEGESLLAMIKACKYMGYESLKPIILKTADELYKDNVEKALGKDPDSPITKGFYQWSTMAYYEIYTTKWKGTKKYAIRILKLAHWMIFTHNTLSRKRNTGYAYEGLVHAWEIANITNDKKAIEQIKTVIDEGLYKLITWQVGSPIENSYLQEHNISDPLAVGGVMNGKDDPVLRIDVTQHQIHAEILAKRYVFKNAK